MEPFVNVRLPVSLWELVKAVATAERRSASAELAALVERALQAPSPKSWPASINRRVDREPAAVVDEAGTADWRAEVAHRLAGLGGQK
jgi:hypothetical protein